MIIAAIWINAMLLKESIEASCLKNEKKAEGGALVGDLERARIAEALAGLQDSNASMVGSSPDSDFDKLDDDPYAIFELYYRHKDTKAKGKRR